MAEVVTVRSWRTEPWSGILSNWSSLQGETLSRLVWILPNEMFCAKKFWGFAFQVKRPPELASSREQVE